MKISRAAAVTAVSVTALAPVMVVEAAGAAPHRSCSLSVPSEVRARAGREVVIPGFLGSDCRRAHVTLARWAVYSPTFHRNLGSLTFNHRSRLVIEFSSRVHGRIVFIPVGAFDDHRRRVFQNRPETFIRVDESRPKPTPTHSKTESPTPTPTETKTETPKPSPTSTVKTYDNCDQLNSDFPHGVGRAGAVDHTSGKPVTNFKVDTELYNANTKLDRDKDGIACERA